MAGSHAQLEWLRDEFAARLASVFESMAGERPAFAFPATSAAPAAGLFWRQPFHGANGELWVAAPEPVWTLAAQQILHAAGMEDADGETLQSTYLETIGQSLSGVAQAITGRLGREVTPAAGAAATLAEGQTVPATDVAWATIDFTFAAGIVSMHLASDAALLDAVAPPPEEEPATRHAAAGADLGEDPAHPSKTFDLLLDVELPVSVSFGRAQVPLKDVLKLTTGSIVELNRSIVEPVEVIVNNCVIARGEVVVVEGNFGVRIQQVVSRQERLRTLT